MDNSFSFPWNTAAVDWYPYAGTDFNVTWNFDWNTDNGDEDGGGVREPRRIRPPRGSGGAEIAVPAVDRQTVPVGAARFL